MSALLTEQGKAVALEGLRERRQMWAGLKLQRNEDLPAGSPMVFRCIGCGAPMFEPETYVTRRKACAECQALLDLGWMEE